MAKRQPVDAPQDIEQLKQRYELLRTKLIRAEADLANAERQLKTLRAEAQDRFGTADLEELQAKLEQMKQENEQKRAEYQQHLEQIETNLGAIESEYEQRSQARGE